MYIVIYSDECIFLFLLHLGRAAVLSNEHKQQYLVHGLTCRLLFIQMNTHFFINKATDQFKMKFDWSLRFKFICNSFKWNCFWRSRLFCAGEYCSWFRDIYFIFWSVLCRSLTSWILCIYVITASGCLQPVVILWSSTMSVVSAAWYLLGHHFVAVTWNVSLFGDVWWWFGKPMKAV